MANNFIPTIGLEIHAELATSTKMFCGCPNPTVTATFDTIKPNSFLCPVCLGLPGSLPVPNQKAVAMAIAIAQSLKCKIATTSKWDRKNYFYPDLPKGFQISQFDLPLGSGGKLELNLNEVVTITRVHLEEDTGKLLHPVGADYSLVDFNRSGVPLVELVTEPVIKTAKLAKAFAQEYQLLLRHLEVADADMEKGQMRVEANVSVSNRNDKFGTKVEIKNLNSFRSVERAIDYEIKRQITALENGEKIIQETRGWDELKQFTIPQRTKETAADYRYFPEPDTPPLQIDQLKILKKAPIPTPNDKRKKLLDLGLNRSDCEALLADTQRLAKFLDSTKFIEDHNLILKIANLLIQKSEQTTPLKAKQIIELAKLPAHLQKAKLAGKAIGRQAANIDIKSLVRSVITQNRQAVVDIKAGKTQAIGVLIGQIMAKTGGTADPKKIRDLIESMIK